MAKFLNTEKLRYWIKELIKRSESELVIVVPYIKTSKEMYQTLKDADEKGIETTIIYRENKLTTEEKEKINLLKNLNLLHHPNIHCKCYFNGELAVICSMNLYEYSEKNNREMGILLHRTDLEIESRRYSSNDEDELFQDAIHEIREIINGAKLERLNVSKKDKKFVIGIIKTEEEKAREQSEELNKYFQNKLFKPSKINRDTWFPECKNYFDKVNISFEANRIAIDIGLPENELKEIYNRWMRNYNEFEFKGFKFYWSYHKSSQYLYRDNKYDWSEIKDRKTVNRKYKQGIDLVISKYRKIAKK